MNENMKLAQLATWLDSDGCISIVDRWIKRPYGRYHIYESLVVIVNTNKRLMDWLDKNFNGWYTTMGTPKNNHKQAYQWHMTDIEQTLKEVCPYLLLKKKQAEIVIDFHLSKRTVKNGRYGERTKGDKFREEGMLEKIRLLNKRGI